MIYHLENSNMKKVTTIIFAFFILAVSGFAQIPDRTNPPRLVNDFAGVLDEGENSNMESALQQFARQTSTQIVVVTVSDLDGFAPGDYAQRLGEEWGVGQKSDDNGLVILVKPKTNESRGEVFVATGYGLEAVLPDAIVNRDIVDNEMIPRFSENDYYGGLAAGINVITDITRGEYTAQQYREQSNAGGGGLPFIFFFFILLFAIFGRSRRRRFYSPGRSLPFWLAMGMMSGGHRSSGSFGNFTSGGGGFGGFGGGSFGGGGAGGSW